MEKSKVDSLKFHACYDVRDAIEHARSFIDACDAMLSFHDDVTHDATTIAHVERMRDNVSRAYDATHAFLASIEQHATQRRIAYVDATTRRRAYDKIDDAIDTMRRTMRNERDERDA